MQGHERHIGDLLKERQNIILKGADGATRGGFTQVPNFLLKSKNLSAGDKLAFAMLLSYAWQNDHCFFTRREPGGQRNPRVAGRSSWHLTLKNRRAARCWLLNERHDDNPACDRCPCDGNLSAR